MSNHRNTQACQFSEVGLVRYACSFDVGASGVVTQSTVDGPYFSVVYSGASGRYTVTLSDVYYKFRGFYGDVVGSTDTKLKLVAVPTVGATSTSFSIDTFSGATASELSSVTIFFELVVNSSVANRGV